MVAVGPGAANYVAEMSIIVLKNAPFNVEKWKNIPEDIFNKIVSKVLDAFDIDNTTHNREVILYTAKRLYRNHRYYFSSPNYKVITKIEESQRQLGEKVDKQVEAKVATMLRQMLNIPGGESSSALDRVS
ncbi:hypothetical protein P8452_69729 [Trifolium repens]|nr:hypothetical protein P8452_69729 [Trifolium repens]